MATRDLIKNFGGNLSAYDLPTISLTDLTTDDDVRALTGKNLAAGQYYDNGKYMVVAGNARQPGWGDFVPPGYGKVGYTTAGMSNASPKGGWNPKQVGENLLILRRLQDPAAAAPAPAPAPAPAAPPAAPELSPEAIAYRKEADAKLTEAQGILDQFKIEQNKADEARKLQEKLAIQSQATAASNLARSQMAPNLQIQPASGTPQTAGTQGFKRRQPIQTLNKTGGLASLNIQTPSTLNI